MPARYPIFVKRDLDGFFGLAIDNLVQMLLIVNLCGAFCGMSGDNSSIIYERIMPGVAVSLLIGNLFYAIQAHWVARREGRSDVTALPYGINTPSLLVYVFFVMMPAYSRTQNADFAWQMGLIACMGSGIIEFAGAFVAEKLRRNTPRAALLRTLAGIAITFISMTFALQIWQRPLVAMVPMAIVLLVYFSKIRFPLGLPGGLVAVILGTTLGWLLSVANLTDVQMSADTVIEAWNGRGQFWPQWAGGAVWEILKQEPAQVLALLSVIIPMGLFNVIGSLQNIESAEAGGDVFATGPSLAVNGLGTIAAALFGSCFPTTIYIGHPGWKGLGARAGYSTLNGLVMTAICLTGTVSLISAVVPLEAGIAIVLWIGIVITAQAFQASPQRHAPAAAIGLFPAIVAWGVTIVIGAFNEANRNPNDYSMRFIAAKDYPVAAIKIDQQTTTAPTTSAATVPVATTAATEPGEKTRAIATTMQDLIESHHQKLGRNTQINGFWLHGMLILERGYIFTCMLIAAISAFLIDRRFFQAAGWALIGAVLTLLGLMHAYQLTGNNLDYLLFYPVETPEGVFAYRAYPVLIGYLLMAGVFLAIGRRDANQIEKTGDPVEDARVTAPIESVEDENTGPAATE
ncbi:MAG: NCS2 family permease [Planctomycetota bacterium]|nr:MAG: NCS2 family permease [Planctomycetota bacterium]